jgi:prepilin-type N-terminal cleavage/methylation domain-containing protein
MSFAGYWKALKRSCGGFTLMELAITMAVAGMLMVSGVGLFSAMKKREREAKTREEMEGIREAVLGYYRNHLVLPDPDSGYTLPVEELNLSPNAQRDEIYSGKYYAYVVTNYGDPLSELAVDGQSIGSTGMVLISRGSNLKFEEENVNLANGDYTQEGTSAGFDDILVYLSANELAASTAWRREIEQEAAVLNQAARILAENDDDGDGFVDQDSTDAPGNSDGYANWALVTGIESLANAGLLWNPDHLVDPWGVEYCWDSFSHEFYSAGPNKTDEGCGGDDICP